MSGCRAATVSRSSRRVIGGAGWREFGDWLRADPAPTARVSTREIVRRAARRRRRVTEDAPWARGSRREAGAIARCVSRCMCGPQESQPRWRDVVRRTHGVSRELDCAERSAAARARRCRGTQIGAASRASPGWARCRHLRDRREPAARMGTRLPLQRDLRRRDEGFRLWERYCQRLA